MGTAANNWVGHSLGAGEVNNHIARPFFEGRAPAEEPAVASIKPTARARLAAEDATYGSEELEPTDLQLRKGVAKCLEIGCV